MERFLQALARLVPVIQVVAEGLHDVVGGDAHVGGAVFEQTQHRTQHAAGGGYFLTVAVQMLGQREVVAKEFVGTVDEMDLHAPMLHLPALRAPDAPLGLGDQRGRVM